MKRTSLQLYAVCLMIVCQAVIGQGSGTAVLQIQQAQAVNGPWQVLPVSVTSLTPQGTVGITPTNTTFYRLQIGATNAAGAPVAIPVTSAPTQALQEAQGMLAANFGGNWSGALLASYAYPVYDAVINGGVTPAYLEFKVVSTPLSASNGTWTTSPGPTSTDLGSILVSLTTQDLPVPDIATGGLTRVEQLFQLAGTSSLKAFRYGDGFWVAEDGSGNVLATIGTEPYALPPELPSLEGTLASQLMTNNVEVYDTGASLLSTNANGYASYSDFKQDYINGSVYAFLRARQAETAQYRMNLEAGIMPPVISVPVGGTTLALPNLQLIAFDIEDTNVAAATISSNTPGIAITGIEDGATILHVVLADTTTSFYTIEVGTNPPPIADGWSEFIYGYAGNCGNQTQYKQFKSGGCLIGCGPTAWAMLYGWWDIVKLGGCGLIDKCPTPTPVANDVAAMACMTYVNLAVGTFCTPDSQGATLPSKEAAGGKWGATRGKTVTEVSEWCAPYCKVGPAILAIGAIGNGYPAIIGIGKLQHYPLAWGYAYHEYSFLGVTTTYAGYFLVNQGWGGDPCAGEWVNQDSVWFGNDVSIK